MKEIPGDDGSRATRVIDMIGKTLDDLAYTFMMVEDGNALRLCRELIKRFFWIAEINEKEITIWLKIRGWTSIFYRNIFSRIAILLPRRIGSAKSVRAVTMIENDDLLLTHTN